MWVLADRSKIKVEDLINVVSAETAKYKRKVYLQIYADCCGASGAFHRLFLKL